MSEPSVEYRVLARKYRPASFDELIGQDALVRTLKNAIESNRIAHAFILTGVRGVGKTTTARIIAKALNYTGADGKAGPTTGDTSDCRECQSIAEGRHPDVLEMDAASHTGVDDIRAILDGVRYAPTSARYKIYIIDEVHMLSKSAFNALLKTLEEPPPHVKFIFATTEIRKVPVTVLSRCQRFDLRRVEVPVLEKHFTSICAKEGVAVDADAITMIARAADGSVRDGLSILDQAMALSGGVAVTGGQVQDMLGLADRGRVLDLLEHALKGEAAEALDGLAELHRLGADADVVVNDLLELTHLMTRLRVAPKTRDMASGLSPEGLERAFDLSGKMSMPTLGRAWQILLKGLAEVNTAPNPQSAAEMVIIRLIYAADLPDPADLIKRLKDQPAGQSAPAGSVPSGARSPEPVALRAVSGGAPVMAVAAPAEMPVEQVQQAVALSTLTDVVSFLEQNREMMWANQIISYAHLVKFQQGRIEMRLHPDAHPKLAQELQGALTRLTGERWMITISGAAGEATLQEQRAAAHERRLDVARANPLVARVLQMFPGTHLDIQTRKED
ncbi:MAG: dnaX [Micavibrio sp.]|nr:dnaX [Micavibrio sp.]